MREIGQMVSIQPNFSKNVNTIVGLQATCGKQAVGPQHINTEFVCARVIGSMAYLRQIVSTDSLISYELAMFADKRRNADNK